MNKDQIAGRMGQAKGRVKEVAGKLIGSGSLEHRGRAEQAGGRMQATYGDAKQASHKQTDRWTANS